MAPSRLNCRNHPFFVRLFPLPGDMEPFFDKILFVEGDIFEACTVSWPKMKRTILEGLWGAVSDLDG